MLLLFNLLSPQHFSSMKGDEFRSHYPALAELRPFPMATGDAAGRDHPLCEPGNPTAAVHTFLESKLYCSIFN